MLRAMGRDGDADGVMDEAVAMADAPVMGIHLYGTALLAAGKKDMAMATLGGLISMCTVALVNWKCDRNFGDEFRESLSLADGDRPLGEVRLAEIRGKDQGK